MNAVVLIFLLVVLFILLAPIVYGNIKRIPLKNTHAYFPDFLRFTLKISVILCFVSVIDGLYISKGETKEVKKGADYAVIIDESKGSTIDSPQKNDTKTFKFWSVFAKESSVEN